MRAAGLNVVNVSQLLQPERYSNTKDDIFETKVLYCTLASQAPAPEKYALFADNLKREAGEDAFRHALSELLIRAAGQSKPDLAKTLLDLGADPNPRSWELGMSAINVANRNKCTNIANLLVGRGADPNVKETYPEE